MGSHATGWSSEAPTPAQLVEFFAQVKSGRITKNRLQPFLRGGSRVVTVEEAREILGETKVFGPENWTKIFGKMVDKTLLAKTPAIPWSEEELRNPGLDQPHFLRLGMEKLDGKPPDLAAWHKLYSDKNVHPRFYADWYLTHLFAKDTCQFRWYLDVIGIVRESNNLSYDRQEAMLPDDYEVPTGSERVSANVQFSLINKGEYLDKDFWARTRSKTGEKEESGFRVNIKGYSIYGLYVDDFHDDARSHIGVAASKKIL